MSLQPFHLAIPVYDVPLARQFYREVFGLEEGRSAESWVDFNFFGHQLVIHFHPRTADQATMFFFDPCGNALEFKAFKDMGQLFAK